MPKFFFALVDEDGVTPDEFGADFDSLEAAYVDGCRAALEISFDMLRERRNPADLRFEITDASGQLLMELAFDEVLHPGKPRAVRPVYSPVTLDKAVAGRATRDG